MLTKPAVLDPDEDMKNAILHMRISDEEKALLDELRKAEDDLPSQSEMVRRLIKRAAAKQTTKRK